MAYNDYGALVYEGASRRQDREDVTLTSVLQGTYDPGTAGGSAIFEHLIEHMGDSAPQPYWAGLKHAILGSGPVYALVYKEGLRPCELVHLDGDGHPDDVLDAIGMRALIGHAADVVDTDDEYVDPLVPYGDTEQAFSFTWHGAKVRYAAHTLREMADEGLAPCELELDDGTTVWRAFYGSEYGAGFVDIEPWAKAAFRRLGPASRPMPWRQVEVCSFGAHDCYVDDERGSDPYEFEVDADAVLAPGIDVRSAVIRTAADDVVETAGTARVLGHAARPLVGHVCFHDMATLLKAGIARAHDDTAGHDVADHLWQPVDARDVRTLVAAGSDLARHGINGLSTGPGFSGSHLHELTGSDEMDDAMAWARGLRDYGEGIRDAMRGWSV